MIKTIEIIKLVFTIIFWPFVMIFRLMTRK